MKFRIRYLWIKLLLLTGGCLSILYFFSWWLEENRYKSPVLIVVWVLAAGYIGLQMGSSWLLNLAARMSSPPKSHPDIPVDIFITTYHEPIEMVEYALIAAQAVRGRKQVWLLDDGNDPVLRDLAQQMGCGYLTRMDNRHAKAGNINAAFAQTSGEVIAIFDIDHAPQPDFLEKSMGYFSDPKMGFVQVMLTFHNFDESWVARAAMESSLEFYNPTYQGAHRIGAATLMGSNALIRRQALLSIGGYQSGLAEDLATSITLHAAGWKSAYVQEPLAPGLCPSNLAAWSVQQLKWARGVFELLLTTLPRLFNRLTWAQRISYVSRMTKYWIGPAVFVHLFATILMLFFANAPARAAFHSYLEHLGPLLLMDALIRAFALRRYRHANLPPATILGAVVLIYASWPIYLVALVFALFRIPVKFQPTPKDRLGRLNKIWLLPQTTAFFLLTLGTLRSFFFLHHPVSLLLTFSILQAGIQLLLLLRWVRADVLEFARAEPQAHQQDPELDNLKHGYHST